MLNILLRWKCPAFLVWVCPPSQPQYLEMINIIFLFFVSPFLSLFRCATDFPLIVSFLAYQLWLTLYRDSNGFSDREKKRLVNETPLGMVANDMSKSDSSAAPESISSWRSVAFRRSLSGSNPPCGYSQLVGTPLLSQGPPGSHLKMSYKEITFDLRLQWLASSYIASTKNLRQA